MALMNYATVGSNNIGPALAFYDGLLASIGMQKSFDHPTGGRVYGGTNTFGFGVMVPFNGQPASVGNGSMFAFSFDTNAEVDAFHAKALELGAADEGAPGDRMPGFYFSYFRDLDGNKLCAFCVPAKAA